MESIPLAWLSGYAAGLARAQLPPGARLEVVAEAPPTDRVTVIYGSQTGNARRVAEKLVAKLQASGFAVRLVRADAYATRELRNERYLALVVSTQGDGDPPDDARALVDFITGKRAPNLSQLRFAVLGLGDSSYPQFCSIGRRLDERLAGLGGQRWFARGDADLDIDRIAEPWITEALSAASLALKPQSLSASVVPLRAPAAALTAFSREKPFPAEVLVNQRISGRDSDRDIRHLELSLEGSGLHYQPGDALGVWPLNPPALVEELLAAVGCDGSEATTHGAQTMPLREWLLGKREITRLSRSFIAVHAAQSQSVTLNRLLAPDKAQELACLLAGQQIIDLVRTHPARWTGDELVAALRPLTPRLYSLASSQKVVAEEAHLTVAHIEYRHEGELRWGAASDFLARAEEGRTVRVFVESNERFRLPADPTRDIIMIGPGTGVAPFRAFVQERVATGASGRNWLLFGNRHARNDFLYQVEWQQALKQGQLHRLDLAFSRDRVRHVALSHVAGRAVAAVAPVKTYVQHRMLEHGRDVHAWLQAGAHLYVCGDAKSMARDVHAVLLALIGEHGGKSPDDAADYLNSLQAQGRYARDIY
ncbi:MAG: assimilatory sulfite reductase (NADPH) flavoprotein subunit [Arenimonas sp.]